VVRKKKKWLYFELMICDKSRGKNTGPQCVNNKQLNMMMEVGLLSTFKISKHYGEESFSTVKTPSVHQKVSHFSWCKKVRHCDHQSDTKSLSRAKSSKCLDFCTTLSKPSITVTHSTKIYYYGVLSIYRFSREWRKRSMNVGKREIGNTNFLTKKVVHCLLLLGRILPQLKIRLFET
jgi:hypothetical protein